VSSDFLSRLYEPLEAPAATGPGKVVRVDAATGEILSDTNRDRTGLSETMAASQPTESSARLRLLGRFADLYLIFQSDDDLLLVDQHTAHERVLYEQTLAQIEAEAAVGQQLLLPEQVELSPEQYVLFEEVADLLRQSGFTVAPFGGRTVMVEAVPSALSGKSPGDILEAVLDDLASLGKAGFDLKKAAAQSIACRAAVKAGDRLSDDEARALLNSLFACENIFTCPHGRPTHIRIARADLDKQFGRE
jgi:DNA mismatch repair protein MutL